MISNPFDTNSSMIALSSEQAPVTRAILYDRVFILEVSSRKLETRGNCYLLLQEASACQFTSLTFYTALKIRTSIRDRV